MGRGGAVIDRLALEPKCLPDQGFQNRWTRAELVACRKLNAHIDCARDKTKCEAVNPSPRSGGAQGGGAP